MKPNDLPPNSISSDQKLDSLLSHSPLQDPPPWFTAQTIARLRRERISHEQRTLRWLCSSIIAIACLLVFLGIEIREQSSTQAIALSSLDIHDSNEESEELWLEQ